MYRGTKAYCDWTVTLNLIFFQSNATVINFMLNRCEMSFKLCFFPGWQLCIIAVVVYTTVDPKFTVNL